MVNVQILCPECSQVGNVEVAENIVKRSDRGITAVKVAQYLVCDHSFIAYIDKNLVVRDCFIADFTLELPEMDFREEIEDKIGRAAKEFDIDIIRLNLPPTLMSNLLRVVVYRKPVLIISDIEILNDHLQKFLTFAFEDLYTLDLTIVSMSEYKANKKLYKKHVIFANREVLQDNYKILKNKNLSIENAIVNKFYSEYDLISSLIIFKNEIHKSVELAETVKKYVNSFNNDGKLTSKKIIDYIDSVHHFKIQRQYYEYLVRIVENYFDTKVPIKDLGNLLSGI